MRRQSVRVAARLQSRRIAAVLRRAEHSRGTIPAFQTKEMHLVSDARVTKQRAYET